MINLYNENYNLYSALNIADPNVEVANIVLEISGEKDGPHWHWILELTDGKFAYLSGWCDYTGWGCQDGAEIHFANSSEEALKLCPQDVLQTFRDMIQKNETQRDSVGISDW